MCLPFHYGFSPEGCNLCDCDPTGSTDMQCDLISGQCPCRDKVEGRKCDRCMENTRSKDSGGFGEKICEPCDDCFNLVKDAADEHRDNLDRLDVLLQEIAENPEPVGEDFDYELMELRVQVKSLLADTKIASSTDDGDTLRDRLENLRLRLQDVIELIMNADMQIKDAKDQSRESEEDVSKVKVVIQRARTALKV
jgi:laminin gamma 1